MSHRRPVAGNTVFEALSGEKTIVMAVNVRMPRGIAKGIMRAAKDTDSVIMFELARSESDLTGGYTGMTPLDYYNEIAQAAQVWQRGIQRDLLENVSKRLTDANIRADTNVEGGAPADAPAEQAPSGN